LNNFRFSFHRCCFKQSSTIFGIMRRLIFGILAVLLSAHAFAADKPDAAPATNGKAAEPSPESQQSLRAYLQLQEQLHAALLAIEQARKDAEAAAQRNNTAIQQAREEAEAAAQRNSDMIGARLKLIEQTLTNQRDRELETMQKSNRFMLTMATVVGGIGFLGMLFTAFCFWRALTRVAQITGALQPMHTLGHHPPAALANSDAPFVTLTGPEMSNTRLLGALERLEKRIHDLEHTALLPHTVDVEHQAPKQVASNGEGVASLLEKGHGFLMSNEPDKAIACFEDVLKTNPHHAEALVKKGTALEHLKRLEEAIACYDKAIAVNHGMTVAYLHKGAVFNQLERFSEALECYEQALRTQQKAVNS
jgi:tetratricopeptide (TPR) repeat protein